MSNGPQDKLQQVIANRPKGEATAAAAETANIVNFQDWLFFGTAPSVFVNVGIVPVNNSTTQISYAVVVLQTPNGAIVSDASVGAGGNIQVGWNLNLATDNRTYDVNQYGNQLQAWAYVQAYVSGQLQEQYSATQNYTVT